MSSKLVRFAKVLGILAATAALASPALVNAEPHGFGGGGHVAHFAAGGGHADRVAAGVDRASAGRAYAGHAYAGRGYSARAYAGPRVGYSAGVRAWGGRGYGYAGGRSWGYRAPWGGGWWNGYYWPAAYYGWSYPWFLAALPLGYATYWWGSVPYYYVDNVYYVYSPADNGYVVSDPPPVAGENTLPPAPDGADDASPPPAGAAPAAPPASGSPDDIYMYPANGQTTQQQATDRYECHKWAQQQTGFDPTQSAPQSSGDAYNYHRAMVACLQGRGYSVN